MSMCVYIYIYIYTCIHTYVPGAGRRKMGAIKGVFRSQRPGGEQHCIVLYQTGGVI